MSKPLIEVKKLTKVFGKNVVLKDIDLTVNDGAIFGVIGESGSGKTTLLKAIIGFLQPEQGAVFYENKNVLDNMRVIKERFGFASQENCFYPKLTVRENLSFFGNLYGMSQTLIDQNTEKLLKFVDLKDAENTLGENLSAGMQRRLDIACSLINNPKILIMDEPTQDLDPVLRREVANLIKRINQAGTTIILTSHLLYEAELLCHEIAILHKGKVLEVGTPDQLKSLYSKNHEIHLETHPGNYQVIAKTLTKGKVSRLVKQGNKLVIYTMYPEVVLKHVLQVIDRCKETLVDVDVKKPSLNEVFESLVKKQ
ncbi:MAG: ABC transporter ATP-binding protein [Candidatus Woesearchaeota archaeon]|nr:MAG: ABC transporter ATP-binding protein [Candidatus Woesearchaeota archaeon]